NDDSALGRKRSATQSRAGAARQKRNSVFIGDVDNLRDLLRSRGKDNDVGFVFEERQTVAFVDQKHGFIIDNFRALKNVAVLVYDFLLHVFVCCSLSFLICSITNAA